VRSQQHIQPPAQFEIALARSIEKCGAIPSRATAGLLEKRGFTL
jgi:hypothetical protein